jgi:hypothetical protein
MGILAFKDPNRVSVLPATVDLYWNIIGAIQILLEFRKKNVGKNDKATFEIYSGVKIKKDRS